MFKGILNFFKTDQITCRSCRKKVTKAQFKKLLEWSENHIHCPYCLMPIYEADWKPGWSDEQIRQLNNI